MPFGHFRLVGLCPTLPTFPKLLKLPKLSPFLAWDTTDKHGLPRQGQYTGQSIVLSVSEIFWWKVWWSQCPTSVLRCHRCPRVGSGTLEWLEDREVAENILVESLAESGFCCNFANEFRRVVD